MIVATRRALRALAPFVLLAAVGCVQVSSVTPSDSCSGEQVVIAGSGFGATQGTSAITFGAATAISIASWSDTSISVAVPAGLSGVVNVVVRVGPSASTPLPFRVIDCPLTGSLGAPRLAIGPGGQPHIAISQSGALVYLTKTGGAWSTPENVDALAGSYDIAATADGRPHVVYEQNSGNGLYLPGMWRYRDPAGWSAAVVACAEGSIGTSCPGIRLVAPTDTTLAVLDRNGDRYGNTWVSQRGFDGTSWGGASQVDYAPIGSYIQDYDAAAGFGSWHATLHRNTFDWGTFQTTYGVKHVLPGSTSTLASLLGSDPYTTPSAAASLGRMHFVWREGANLVHRWRDMTTGAYSAPLTIATVTGSPRPVVAADANGDDGAFALWVESGKLMGSVFDASSASWGAPVLVASNAVSTPVAAARKGVIHLAWKGSADDLRYTTLP
ncbi:MAG: IPT/TIG domain-containing protein [bacterium]